MHRRIRLMIGAIAILAALAGESRAQVGYGGYGWGGWTASPQGDLARGLGYFDMGAGVYNRETAVAESINADTLMRFNEYIYESQMESTRHYIQNRDARLARDRDAYDAFVARVRDNPSEADIGNGDALNSALDQLSDPRIHSSALRMASAPIDAALIRQLPFRHNVEAVSFSLAQMKASSHWPSVLMDDRFAPEREDFEKAIADVRTDSLDGKVEPDSIARLRDPVKRLGEKLTAQPLKDRQDNMEAIKFLKTATALTRLLENPEIDQAIAELRKIDKTSVGHLLGFMHTYNLRFAPANTAEQRNAYAQLYPILDQTRDKILGEAKLDATPPPPAASKGKGRVNDFFSGMEMNHLQGRRRPATAPAPPQAQQPQAQQPQR